MSSASLNTHAEKHICIELLMSIFNDEAGLLSKLIRIAIVTRYTLYNPVYPQFEL